MIKCKGDCHKFTRKRRVGVVVTTKNRRTLIGRIDLILPWSNTDAKRKGTSNQHKL